MSEHDTVLASKDAEVEALKARNTKLEASVSRSTASSIVTGTGTHVPVGSSIEPPGSGSAHRPVSAPKSDSPPILTAKPGRRGKAPPVDPYDGENSEIQFDDWLPALHRAAMWNEWTDEESLVQLAGHLTYSMEIRRRHSTVQYESCVTPWTEEADGWLLKTFAMSFRLKESLLQTWSDTWSEPSKWRMVEMGYPLRPEECFCIAISNKDFAMT